MQDKLQNWAHSDPNAENKNPSINGPFSFFLIPLLEESSNKNHSTWTLKKQKKLLIDTFFFILISVICFFLHPVWKSQMCYLPRSTVSSVCLLAHRKCGFISVLGNTIVNFLPILRKLIHRSDPTIKISREFKPGSDAGNNFFDISDPAVRCTVADSSGDYMKKPITYNCSEKSRSDLKKTQISHRSIDSSRKCGIKSYLYRHPLRFL